MYFTSFFPEAIVDTDLNWQVFWLAFFLRPSHPDQSGQWQEYSESLKRLTAAGTAPVLHRIPYYSILVCGQIGTNSMANV
jgi:hypothetical protein